jgi:hypothetical protein
MVFILLLGTLLLAGAGLLEQTALANKSVAACGGFGCGGGSDACMTITVGNRGVYVTVTCYGQFTSQY